MMEKKRGTYSSSVVFSRLILLSSKSSSRFLFFGADEEGLLAGDKVGNDCGDGF